tara:strand:- start:42 stop:350 length:309 start_codon:yes stop_codon:yes gene_type:complete
MYVFRLVALVYLSSHAAAHVLLHNSKPNSNPNPNPNPNPNQVYSTTRPMYVFRLVALIYLSSHAAAHVLLLRPGRVLRSFLRREASPYVGAQQQLAVPTLKS